MQLHSDVSLDQGHRNLKRILTEIGSGKIDWNEANTRFHIIDLPQFWWTRVTAYAAAASCSFCIGVM
jgi:hypothetical protein